MDPDNHVDEPMHAFNARPKERTLKKVLQVLLAVPVSAICCGMAWWLTVTAMSSFSENGFLAAGLVGLAVFVGVMVMGIKSDGKLLRPALEVLVLVVLVAWGLTLNFLMPDSCEADPCGGLANEFRFFAVPYVFGLLALHVVTALAYTISRKHPDALPPLTEVLVAAMLLVGTTLHAVVAVQFGVADAPLALVPPAMPIAAPFLTVALYGAEVVQRLRRRGAERLSAPEKVVVPTYRESGPPTIQELGARAHPHILLKALVASPLLIGVYTLVMALLFREWTAAAKAFTETCGHTLSQIPIQPATGDCHYLCTVAAQGHASVVRPERFGIRHGRIILVNRQLAIANAFEDLLHARWPRFGRAARAAYDRLGLPVSHHIRTRWMADAVYLVMKPVEWAFYLALLLLDSASPEQRIDRMYR